MAESKRSMESHRAEGDDGGDQVRRWEDDGGEAAERVVQGGSEMIDSITRAITDRPLMSIAIAIGVGYILAGRKKRSS